ASRARPGPRPARLGGTQRSAACPHARSSQSRSPPPTRARRGPRRQLPPPLPQEDERGARVRAELLALPALRARPEDEATVVEVLEDDRARRRPALRRRGREHDWQLLFAPPLLEHAHRVRLHALPIPSGEEPMPRRVAGSG